MMFFSLFQSAEIPFDFRNVIALFVIPTLAQIGCSITPKITILVNLLLFFFSICLLLSCTMILLSFMQFSLKNKITAIPPMGWCLNSEDDDDEVMLHCASTEAWKDGLYPRVRANIGPQAFWATPC